MTNLLYVVRRPIKNGTSQDANFLYLEPAVLNNDVVEIGGKSPKPRENGCDVVEIGGKSPNPRASREKLWMCAYG